MMTRTGSTPYLYGFTLPKAGRACSSVSNTLAATVTPDEVW